MDTKSAERRRIVCLVAAVVSLLATVGVSSSQNEWTFNGPAGGYIRDVAVSRADPDVAFAVSGKSLYRFDNESNRWNRTFTASTQLGFVIVSNVNPDIVFLLVGTSSLMRSVDGGDTFFQVESQGLITSISQNLAGHVFITNRSTGVFRSLDLGDSWQASNDGLPQSQSNVAHEEVAASLSNSNRLYTLVRNAQLGVAEFYKSDDGGASWTEAAGMGLTYEFPIASGMHVSEANPLHIIVSRPNALESFDGGETWSTVTGPFDSLRTVTNSPLNQNTSYAASYDNKFLISTDAGVNWSVEADFDPPVFDLAMRADGSGILASTEGVLSRSSTIENWTDSNAGLVSTNIVSLVQNSQTGRVYTGLDTGGIYTTIDAGASWLSAGGKHGDGRGLPAGSINGLAVAPDNDQLLYAGSSISSSWFKSIDGGMSWVANGDIGFTDDYVNKIAIAPSDSSRVYVGTWLGRMFSTRDGGESWAPYPLPGATFNVAEIAVSPFDPDLVLASTQSSFLYRTTDGGNTWNQLDEIIFTGAALSIAFSPHVPGRVYLVNSANNVYRSDDYGLTWNQLSTSAIPFPFSYHEHPVHESILFAHGRQFGMARSLDGGVNWELYDENPEGIEIFGQFAWDKQVAIDQLQSSRVFYGTLWNGFGEYVFSRDVGIRVESAPGQVAVESNALLEYEVRNDSSDVSGRVRVSITVPAQTAVAQVTPLEQCEINAGGAECVFSRMTPGQLESVGITISASTTGVFQIDAAIASIEAEIFPDDNLASVNLLVGAESDYDLDGVVDTQDNCTLIANQDQRDTDGDGYGNFCDADFDQNLTVNFLDVIVFAENFGEVGDLVTDLNGDNLTNFVDLNLLANSIFGPPGPSASN